MEDIHLQLAKRLKFLHVGKQVFYRVISIALCPQELLEIHRKHLIVFFIPYAVAFDLLVIDSQHWPTANHIKPPIYAEELERCCNFRKLRDLVEEDQRLFGHKLLCRVNEWNVLDNVSGFISVRDDSLVFLVTDKIDLDHIFVMIGSKMQDRFRFAYLTASLDNKGLSVFICFPFL